MRSICPICDKYAKTEVQCGYCQRWFHFKCENTTEEQVSKEYPAEKHMHTKPTSKVLKYFAVSVSEEHRRNRRTKIKV